MNPRNGFLCACVLASASASAVTVDELRSMNATRLVAADVRPLVTGAKVTNTTNQGSSRFWTNDADGKFFANSDNRKSGYSAKAAPPSPGTWRVEDDGRYCVTIDWPRIAENWCRFLFRAGDNYYGVTAKQLEDGNAQAWDFTFAR